MRYAESAEAQTELRRVGLVLPGILDQASACACAYNPPRSWQMALWNHGTMSHLVFWN